MQNVLTQIRKLSLLMTMLAGVAVSLSSCSDSDDPETVPSPQEFEGTFVTTIPAMPDFAAVEGTNAVTIEWEDASQTETTVKVGAFTITTGMAGKDYEIGAMTIAGVRCSKSGDGVITLSQPDFACQAGEFATTGSLSGTLDGDELSLTLLYKPGSMPFEVQSRFTGK